MINPTREDIGRHVVYITKHNPPERGVITGFNKHWVHVKYKGDRLSKATSREQLEWIPKPTSPPLPQRKVDFEAVRTIFTTSSMGTMIGFRLLSIALKEKSTFKSLLSAHIQLVRTGIPSVPAVIMIQFEALWSFKYSKSFKYKPRRKPIKMAVHGDNDKPQQESNPADAEDPPQGKHPAEE